MKLTLRAKRVFVGAAAGALVLSLLPTAAAADNDVCDNAEEDVFPDVNPGATHADEIDCLYSYGITTGYGDGEYKPLNDVSRQEMATFLVRTWEAAKDEDAPAGDSDFTDLGDAAVSHQANIETAATAGIADGYPDNTYRPLEDVTRNQMASFIINLMVSLDADIPEDADAAFPDVESTSVHYDAINQLAELGVVEGFGDGTYGPWQNVQRQEMASFIIRTARVLDEQGLWEGSIEPPPGVDNPTYTDAPELLRVTSVGSNVLSYEFDSNVTGEALEFDDPGFPEIRLYDHFGDMWTPTEASIDGDRVLARYTEEQVQAASRGTVRYNSVESPTGLPALEGAFAMSATAVVSQTDPFVPDLLEVDNWRTANSQDQTGETAVVVDFTFGRPGDDLIEGEQSDPDDTADEAWSAEGAEIVASLLGFGADEEDHFGIVGSEGRYFSAEFVHDTIVTDTAATFALEFQIGDVDELPEGQLRRGVVHANVNGNNTVDSADGSGVGDPWLAENYGTTGGTTFEPDLISVQRIGAGSFAFEFDEAVSPTALDPDGDGFYVYDTDGNVTEMTDAERSNIPEDEARVVYVEGPTLPADGEDDAPVGAFVDANTVLGTDTQAGENEGWNQPDQVNLTLPAPDEEEFAAGVTGFLDLESVVRTRNIVTGTYSVTFTVSGDEENAGDIAFDLYDVNGTQFRAVASSGDLVNGSITFEGGAGDFANEQIIAAVVGAIETEGAGTDPESDIVVSEGAIGIEDAEQ